MSDALYPEVQKYMTEPRSADTPTSNLFCLCTGMQFDGSMANPGKDYSCSGKDLPAAYKPTTSAGHCVLRPYGISIEESKQYIGV